MQLLQPILLFSAIAALLAPIHRGAGFGLLIASYGLALVTGQLSSPSLIALILLIAAAYAVTDGHPRLARYLGHGLFVALTIALSLHWMPGFNNWRIIGPERLTPDAVPFTMYFNLDKPLSGAWLLLVLPWLRPRYALRQLPIGLAGAALAIMLTLPIALAAGMTAWSPKWPASSGLWLANNLLIVTAMEEVVFRGYLQGGLSRCLQGRRHGDWIALLLSSAVFGLAHFSGGSVWMLLAGLAGLAYGCAFRFGGLPAAIIAHFGLNAAHFFLFVYPMLQTGT
ncbi:MULTISPECIES: CPBP family intramembrane glutamic endopeptidase [unclassified Chelatococcus]|uniref:CPBP family intramembrane glutamic endopeptidase n=1 Tax=unclassified Chelatococcus TaxID=2638111 RepID=UPI001BCDDB6A|nr:MULTISPECIES: CPBP family intramembrane glutamic endopeptidase [unclassified Chelatococcus]MBS7697039.1 CPBP family intramembrane metalloprotease [Chelatococcus sp. YT9]MBX3556029.1 CPBP family intramembrane metalloprotease [Chelatococcus sp.]